MDAQDKNSVVGWTDGFERGHVEGWAWRPQRPHEAVIVQMLVDGLLVAECPACMPRPDLQTAGIGNGNYAFSIPLVIDADARPVLHITVRVKDGPVLPSGNFEIASSAEEKAQAALRQSGAYLDAVFGPLDGSAPRSPAQAKLPSSPPLNFILYSATAGTALASAMGMPEYSYFFVMRGFREVLRRLGTVHVITDPVREVDDIYQACMARGQSCLMLSFAPPQSTPLGLRCPTIPVIAWEFGTIPTGGWPGDIREDWRFVLRQTGRALTISEFAAQAVRATMGACFPVAFVPTPVFDRQRPPRTDPTGPHLPVRLALEGIVWDSREVTLSLEMRPPSLPQIVREHAAMLPMRGAQLALAGFSAKAQADARVVSEAASLRAAEEREQEREREREREREQEQERERALALAEKEPEERDISADLPGGGELAALDAATIAEPTMSPPRMTLGGRIRVTGFYAREWYREVLRDTLPKPLSRVIAGVGRQAVALRASSAPPPQAHVVDEPVPAAAEESQAHQYADPVLVQADEPPAPHQQVEEPDQAAAELPADEGNLLVEEARRSEEVPPRPSFLPAQTDPMLPEPVLAIFYPDPYPAPPRVDRRSSAIIDGVVFTAVLSPKDGRKNWQDILTAFATAFRDTPQATLVFKMIGADAAFWWWEFHSVVKLLPRFACRIVVLSGYLDEANYQSLIDATHFIVNASLAEGQCLPLVEFMSAGCPAIAPLHTAMLDYITPDNALIIAASAEFCAWPHDPRNHLTTSRYRIEWSSLHDAFMTALRIVEADAPRHAAMGQAAARDMRAYCGDAVVAPRLAAFLGLDDEALSRAGWSALPRHAAEPLLEPYFGLQANVPA